MSRAIAAWETAYGAGGVLFGRCKGEWKYVPGCGVAAYPYLQGEESMAIPATVAELQAKSHSSPDALRTPNRTAALARACAERCIHLAVRCRGAR